MVYNDFEQFTKMQVYHDFTFSPDGQWIAYISDLSGQPNIWRQALDPLLDGVNSQPQQITAWVDDAAHRVFWSPDGSYLLVLADRYGTENYQLYTIATSNGAIVPLTAHLDVRHEIGEPYSTDGLPFHPNGQIIAYASNQRDPANLDVFVRDLTSGVVKAALEGEGRHFPASWSPDGRTLLIWRINQGIDHDLFAYDFSSGTIQHLTPDQGECRFYPGPWKADSSGFYLRSDQGRDFLALGFYDVKRMAIIWVETPDADVQALALSSDERYLAWVTNEHGYSCLSVRDQMTRQVREYKDLPQGVYLSSQSISQSLRFVPAKPLLGLYIASPTHPADLYLLNVETGQPRCLTQSFSGDVSPQEMVKPELITYPTFDGRQIPAWLYRPTGNEDNERVPVVVFIHGGPEFQEFPDYGWGGLYQYLLRHKIGILAPNIRGSRGYGRTYQKLIYHDWGGGELQDLEHAAFYLRSREWVDAERLGVVGGSFGGFATLSCISRLPQYWAAAVDLFGIANLLTFARTSVPSWRKRMKQWVGDPQTEADFLLARSPVSYVDQIRAPLLILQGAHDPRVPKTESDQIVERLRSRGSTVEYVVFENEGHGFAHEENKRKAWRLTAEWLERYLSSEGRQ